MKKEINILTVLMLLLVASAGVACAATSKVIITFDDGWTSQYYYAFPILHANGQNATAFIITAQSTKTWAGGMGAGYMNVSQLNTLYSAGWDLGSHTVNHKDLTTLTPANMSIELNDSKAWLNSKGYTRASNLISYPFGGYNAAVIAAVQNSGYIAARTIDKNFGSYPQYTASTPDAYQMITLRVYGVAAYGNNVTPPSYIKDEINKSIAGNGLLILTYHNITNGGVIASEDYSKSDFKEVSDFLKVKQDSGELDVVTMSSYLNPSKIRNTYEYMIVPNMVLVTLDQLVGWELVAVIQTDSSTREFYLKRRLT